MIGSFGSPQNLRALLAGARSVDVHGKPVAGRVKTQPFVTVSREPGADDLELGKAVLTALNETADPPWTGWDRELVEKVARDHHLAKEVVESLQQRHRTWLSDLFVGITMTEHPEMADLDAVYRHVADTITSLAQVGRCVVVGAGAMLLTQRMPGGVHIRLVASPEFRRQRIAEQFRLTPELAARRLNELENIREEFFKRYFKQLPRPDQFSLTINTERIPMKLAVQMVVDLVHEEERRH